MVSSPSSSLFAAKIKVFLNENKQCRCTSLGSGHGNANAKSIESVDGGDFRRSLAAASSSASSSSASLRAFLLESATLASAAAASTPTKDLNDHTTTIGKKGHRSDQQMEKVADAAGRTNPQTDSRKNHDVGKEEADDTITAAADPTTTTDDDDHASYSSATANSASALNSATHSISDLLDELVSRAVAPIIDEEQVIQSVLSWGWGADESHEPPIFLVSRLDLLRWIWNHYLQDSRKPGLHVRIRSSLNLSIQSLPQTAPLPYHLLLIKSVLDLYVVEASVIAATNSTLLDESIFFSSSTTPNTPSPSKLVNQMPILASSSMDDACVALVESGLGALPIVADFDDMTVIGVFDTSDYSTHISSSTTFSLSHHESSSFSSSGGGAGGGGEWSSVGHYVSATKDNDVFRDCYNSTILPLDATVENAVELVCFTISSLLYVSSCRLACIDAQSRPSCCSLGHGQ